MVMSVRERQHRRGNGDCSDERGNHKIAFHRPTFRTFPNCQFSRVQLGSPAREFRPRGALRARGMKKTGPAVLGMRFVTLVRVSYLRLPLGRVIKLAVRESGPAKA